MGIEHTRVNRYVHETFTIGILLKGINGIFEMVGAGILLFVSPAVVSSLISTLTLHEIAEDPADVIANYLLGIAHSFSLSTQIFLVMFLLSHGVVKLFLVIALLKRKSWAYPLAIVIFLLFILYQLYRFSITHSIGLMVLSIVDVVVIVLTWLEYNSHRQRSAIA